MLWYDGYGVALIRRCNGNDTAAHKMHDLQTDGIFNSIDIKTFATLIIITNTYHL